MRHKRLHRFLSACRGQDPISVSFKQHFPTLKHGRCVIGTEDHWFPAHGCTPSARPKRYIFKERRFSEWRILAFVNMVEILLDEGVAVLLSERGFSRF